jgi:serine/threonine-protein kinase
MWVLWVSESGHAAASRSSEMAVESRVQELLDEICDSGCTPEQVCAACPERLPEVRRRWQQRCAVKADLHAPSFPDPHGR